tara:strand:- start:219 stop:557 length:339 start_codon:yes stop_codon:yes gene_type:complete
MPYLKKGNKSLQKDSAFEEFDIDGDGIVSDEEITSVKTMHEVEEAEEKADAQRQMAWTSLIVMIVFTGLVFLPIFPDSRIKAVADLFGLFYIGMAGVVGAYMGMTAYMGKKK